MTRPWRTASVVLAVATAQAGAVLVYRWVERERIVVRTSAAPFAHERLMPRPGTRAGALYAGRFTPAPRRLSRRPVLLHFLGDLVPTLQGGAAGAPGIGRELDRQGGAQVVALATDEDWDDMSRFFGGRIPPGVVRGPAGEAAKSFEVSVLPDTYLIGVDGGLLMRFASARDWSSEAARALLHEMTPEGGSPKPGESRNQKKLTAGRGCELLPVLAKTEPPREPNVDSWQPEPRPTDLECGHRSVR